jgi:septal ring factor EnvC (AmiA/AmiB activator)
LKDVGVARSFAAALLVLALAALAAPPARAQSPEDSLAALKRVELERIQREARQNREAASRLKGQESRAMSQLRRTERSLSRTEARLRALRSRRQRLDLQLDVTRVDLQRKLGDLDEQRARLGRRLRALYKFGPARELEFLLSTQTFAQLLARWDYLVMVARQDRQMLEDVQSRKEVVETLEHRLRGHLSEVDRTTRQTSGENKRLAAQRAARRDVIRDIQTQREAFEAAAAELEKTARDIRNLLATLERRRSQAPVPYTGDFARGQGALDWPVRGQVVGRFGLESNPRFPSVKVPNNGIDIEAAIGTPVRAVARGRVDYTAEEYGTYGQIVILNHGDSYYTLYGHLSDIAVSVGQEVPAGHVIGRSGDTGSLKGPVLHFEVRRGGTALNPQDWLR